jgi:predicted nucleotidyltransferase
MKEKILKSLENIERQHEVTILYACESGSRAWGFASTDSDYDVRFVYVQKESQYLSLQREKDTIEVMLDGNLLDLSGWDLKKTLLLFQKSNPPLLEWLRSPDVYIERFDFSKRLLDLDYFNPTSVVYHYLHMAENQYKDYKDRDMIKLKKYFYTMRPLLCCKWILHNDAFPPMEFEKLLALVAERDVLVEIEALLDRKRSGQETDMKPRIPVLDNFIARLFESVRENQNISKHPLVETEKLNKIFRELLTIPQKR